jgi:hypothetical protein
MPRGAKPKIYPPDLVELIRDMYRKGATQAEVADALSLTRKVVYNVMRRHDIARRIAAKRNQSGERNASWRGDHARYAAAHCRVYTSRGQRKQCEECGTTDPSIRYQWASLTKNYTDPMDYRRLCESCHSRFDNKVRNLGAYAVRKECPVS